MQISPNSLIPVSYSTTIPGDTTLYYVRAVLRDTQSSTVLQTLNLTNVSSTPNRYTGVFQPVSDPSGLGRPVDVTISVYTDSGYTTLSPNYQIVQYNYVILQPWIQNLGMGGGMNIDYDKLQKMFDGAQVTNAEIGNEKPKGERINYKRLEESTVGATEASRSALSEEFKGHIVSISKLLSDISKDQGDLGTLHMERLDALDKRIQSLEGNISKGQQLSSKERNAVKFELSKSLSDFREEFKNTSEEGSKTNEKRLKSLAGEFQSYLEENLSEKEIKMVYSMTPQKQEKEQKPQYHPDDIASLLRS